MDGEKLNLMEGEKHTGVYFHFKTFIDVNSKSTGNRQTTCYHTVVSVEVSVWTFLAITNVKPTSFNFTTAHMKDLFYLRNYATQCERPEDQWGWPEWGCVRQSGCQENKCCAMAETLKWPSLYLQHVAMCSIRELFLFSALITIFLQVIKISRVKATNFRQENNMQSNLRFDRKHTILLKQKKKNNP